MAMPRADLAIAAEAELADLERLWQTMDVPGHRVELIDGQIVVSPSPSRRHSRVVTELMDQLVTVRRRGWQRDTNLTVHVPVTRERLVPDFIVAPADAPGFGDDEVLAPGVLLVVEVVSPSSRRQDHEVKLRAYAQGGIPLYLLVDAFADPPTVTLYSHPGDDGYYHQQTASGGQPLRLPDPFAIKLDAARLLA